MFQILVIHADMVSLSKPTSIDLSNSPSAVIARYLFESVGIVSVDVFVMISGWFLVKTKTKGVLSFIYQILFFWCGGYLAMLASHNAEFNINGILNCFAFTNWDWFIKAYLVIFIVSPILNIYIQNSNENVQRQVLVWFFIFTYTIGWMGGASRFFVNGYGPLSFIGLYLLSNYARRAKESTTEISTLSNLFRFNKYYDLLIFVFTVFVNTVIGLLALELNISLFDKIYAYINPLVIVGALYFLLFFSKLNLKQNRIINWLAASSFSVYLLHSQIDIRNIFTVSINNIYNANEGVATIGIIFLFLVIVYLVSVLIDQIRIFTWNLINKKFNYGRL